MQRVRGSCSERGRKGARNKCRKIHNERNKCSRSRIFFSFALFFFLVLPRCVVALAQPSPPCAEPLFNKFNYLPFDGSGNPSNVHEICGVGLPAAEHFKLTAGPGCSVCSMKLYSSTGGASVGTNKHTHIADGMIYVYTYKYFSCNYFAVEISLSLFRLPPNCNSAVA